MVVEAHPKEISLQIVLGSFESKYISNPSYFYLWISPQSLAFRDYFSKVPRLLLVFSQRDHESKSSNGFSFSIIKWCAQPFSNFHHLRPRGYFQSLGMATQGAWFRLRPKVPFLSTRFELCCISPNQFSHKGNDFKLRTIISFGLATTVKLAGSSWISETDSSFLWLRHLW